MNRLLSGAVKAAGSLAVVGGMALASALPASAVTLPRSWGAQATGAVSLSQVALAAPGNTPAYTGGVSLPGFLATGFILDRAGVRTSYSSVQLPSAYVAPALATISASKVTSMCTSGRSGTSMVYGGTITQYGQPAISLPLNPGINDQIQIPGGVTITLNKQNVGAGIRQVTAIYIAYPGQNVSLGVTRC